MTYYLVVQTNILGAIVPIGLYEEEIVALRAANESVMRKVIPMELIQSEIR